uniref:DUF11 domain-containing protein n=1 Tax=Methanobrevibacter sp. TaxID=66852 RepID=UPI00388E38F2
MSSQGDNKMFKNKIAISKNFLIAICFISLILFAVNNVDAMELNDSNPDCVDTMGIEVDGINTLNAIDEDKLGNSQENILSAPGTMRITNGNFSQIQNLIHYNLSDGDTLDLCGNFKADGRNSYILVYKNISFISTSGATLDGRNLSNIFVVEATGSGSSFSNLVFKNGNAQYGGAIYVFGKDVTIDDCEFYDNYASAGGGALYTDYLVDQNPDNGRNLLIRNSKFINNFAVTASGAVGAYGYNTRIIGCTFESNRVYNKNGGGVYGGAMQVGRENIVSNSLIKDCKFINNSAISRTGTQLSHGGASCLREGVTYENCLFEGNSADFGGALTAHYSGTIKNCSFIANSANDYGGAITNVDRIDSTNLKIIQCNFDSNTAPYGGAARLAGYSVTIEDSTFNNNYASIDGGAVYIKTKTLDIYDSNFTDNSAQHNGGAVYVNGESTTVQGSRFISNVAIANPNVNDDGLGGAIYINGTSDSVKNNVFEYNVARNGSAIYYDKEGKDLKVTNNVMTENQAWVYALPVYANDIYYGEDEEIGAVIYGGNNIAKYNNLPVSNAIYNAAINRYIKVDGQTPISGATNSGELYQDAREYNIDILLTVKHSDGTVVYNNTLKSSYLGEVNSVLTNLRPGTYTLTATHYEDNYYKAITNQTTFVVKPKVDVGVKKATTSSEFNYHDLAVWTLTVTNDGPNDATGVKVSDVLPAGLVYRSYSATVGSYSNGIWDIGNLAKGASATIRITTLIDKTGEITNNANVSANELDWDMTNNQDSQKINVNPACDLAITKTSNVTNPNYGDLVKWTLTVTNNGPDAATNVVVDDVMPAGLVIVSSPNSYSSGKWNVGTLNAGRSASIEIVTRVAATGSIINSAGVKGDQYDYNPSNNNASKTINVAKATDLVVSKTVDVSAPNYGDLVRWTVTVRNNGPDAATGVKVTDVLPDGLVYKSYSASVGSYSNGIWNVGNLANGASATLTIVTMVNKIGSILNSASVTGNEHDYNPNNNRASKSIGISSAADLAVTKSVNVSSPNYGDLVRWIVTVRNNGPDVATGVCVRDVLPDGLIYLSYVASVGSYSDDIWGIGDMANGASETLTIVTKVAKTGAIVNVAEVSGNEHDHEPDNNIASKFIGVDNAVDLAITKTSNVTNPNYGDLVKWTLTVTNNGPDVATNVVVDDVMPASLVIVSSPNGYGSGAWVVGTLNVGRSASIEIVTRVNVTGSIMNSASARCDEYDHNPSNNNASKTINVAKATDLAVSKSVDVSAPNYGDLVRWTVTVRNNGPDAASGVRVSDVLPAGLVYNYASASAGSYSNGIWNVGSLANGASATLTIVTRVNKSGSLTNVAVVSGNEHDYNHDNNRASKSIGVANAADLAVSKSVNVSAPNYGDLVKWTLTVTNNGPDVATNVVVDDVMPAGLVIVSSPNSYSSGKWTVGTLNVGRSASIEIVTRVDATGSFRNSASVSGDQYDPNQSNNNANSLINVAKATDLEVNKVVNNSNPNYNDLVSWTVTVRNNGPDAASGVKISDVLPVGLAYQSYVASVGSFSAGVWSVGNMANGASETLTIVTRIAKTGTIVNVADVSGNEHDYNPNNNRASKSINVAKATDLVVSKTVDVSAPNYGDLVRWTVTVRNNGPDAASGVRVSDVLPAGLVYQSCAASVGSYSNGIWNIGS